MRTKACTVHINVSILRNHVFLGGHNEILRFRSERARARQKAPGQAASGGLRRTESEARGFVVVDGKMKRQRRTNAERLKKSDFSRIAVGHEPIRV